MYRSLMPLPGLPQGLQSGRPLCPTSLAMWQSWQQTCKSFSFSFKQFLPNELTSLKAMQVQNCDQPTKWVSDQLKAKKNCIPQKALKSRKTGRELELFSICYTQKSPTNLGKGPTPFLDNVRILKVSLMERSSLETFNHFILYLYSVYVYSPCCGRVAGDEPRWAASPPAPPLAADRPPNLRILPPGLEATTSKHSPTTQLLSDTLFFQLSRN